MRKSLYRRHNQVFLGLLRRYREQGKFRQRDLAQHLGSVQATVSKAETGTRRLDVIELREWLLAMGVDFLEFMTELHQQLQALNALEPWLFGRAIGFPSELEPATDGIMSITPEAPPNHGSNSPGQSALMAELERVREELRPDPVRSEDRRMYFERHTRALADLLVPLMRDGLQREVAETLADLDNLQIRGRPVSRWLERLSARHGSDIEPLLQPGDAEIQSNAQELSQLLLSNWLGLLTHAPRLVVGQLIDALRHDPPSLPTEVTTGCLAYPVGEKQARVALMAYLRTQWAPDILNQWRSDWGDESGLSEG